MAYNQTVTDALAAELAELERVTVAPSEPLYYGRDLSCVTDCDALFSLTPPSQSPLVLAQAVTRRYLTPRGGLLDEADYGLDVRGYLNRGTVDTELRGLEARARLEALKDERVSDAEVEVTFSADYRELSLTVRLTPVDTRTRPFSFVVSVTDAQVLLDLGE